MAEAGSLLLAEVVLWLVYIVSGLALLATLVSLLRPLKVAPRRPSGRVWLVAGLTALLLLVTWLAASTQPIVAGGTLFSDTFWLRATDMMIVSSTVLIVVATLLVVIGEIRSLIR